MCYYRKLVGGGSSDESQDRVLSHVVLLLTDGREEEEQVDQLGGSNGEGRTQGDGSLDTVLHQDVNQQW